MERAGLVRDFWLFPLHMLQVLKEVQRLFAATTDPSFIRSEVNGRRSRRIVLFAFFLTDCIGATLWATWCESWWGGEGDPEQKSACSSFGINRYLLLVCGVPVEGAMLYLAGKIPFSFWSDGILLPVWLIRLGFFDVLLWDVPPPALVGDALWFSVMAVMCRVHSLALAILVLSQVGSLILVFRWSGALTPDNFDHVRYGLYSGFLLVTLAGTYFLEEQTRLHSYSQLMYLEGQNAELADRLIRWKVLPGSGDSAVDLLEGGALSRTRQVGCPEGWRHIVREDSCSDLQSSGSSTQVCTGGVHGFREHPPSPSEGAGASTAQSYTGGARKLGIGRAGVRGVRFSLPQTSDSLGNSRVPVPTRKPRASTGVSTHHPVPLRDLFEVME